MENKYIKTEYIDLLNEKVNQSNGVAIDIGGTLMKVIYRSKYIMPGEKTVPVGFIRFRFDSFQRPLTQESLEALKYIVDSAKNYNGEKMIIYTSSASCNWRAHEALSRELNIMTKNIKEADCFVRAFIMIFDLSQNFPSITKELYERVESDERKKSSGTQRLPLKRKISDVLDQNYEKGKSILQKSNEGDSYVKLTKDVFPCIMFYIGSSFGGSMIFADGKSKLVESYPRGGRSFLGIGNLITGTTTFEELVQLAENGSERLVNSTFLRKDPQNERAGVTDMCFGETMFSTIEQFKPEDLARALVVQYTSDIAQTARLFALANDIGNVFFVGNFANSTIIKKELLKYLLHIEAESNKGKQIKYYFVKHGGYLGAIGALLKSSESKKSNILDSLDSR